MRNLTRLGLALAAVAAAAPTIAAGSAHGTAASSKVVRLRNIKLSPAKITVHRGSSVKWVWLDAQLATPHNITSRGGGRRFRSSRTMVTGSYTVRFSRPGHYFYECSIHPASMQGEITVT